MPAQPLRSYRLASSDTLVNLEKAVNQALQAGWQPYGAPFLTHDNRVVQALALPAGVQPAPGAAPTPQGISAVQPTAQRPAQAQPQPQPQAQRQPAPSQQPPQAARQAPQPAAARVPQGLPAQGR